MDLLTFLNQKYVMLIPALWVIGAALKNTPIIPDWTIIWILFLCSITIGSLAHGFTYESVVNGIIAAGIAVFGHQMLKQTLEGGLIRKQKK
ncbi:phage holin family protein [Cytobacillus gottheilii]|uniref:Phage holin family protein n=1 Tax=Cytobacillus gottheilii TaxID=859144 RepID=A0ABX8FHD7_9BACI|nr:phage holin family protein [Cytobacillus gottheilii]QVY63416.1 phage holin family protein [Cytobacillus gottheilii]